MGKYKESYHTRLTVLFSKEDREKIRVLSARNGMSSGEWIREMLLPYLKKGSKDLPEDKNITTTN